MNRNMIMLVGVIGLMVVGAVVATRPEKVVPEEVVAASSTVEEVVREEAVDTASTSVAEPEEKKVVVKKEVVTTPPTSQIVLFYGDGCPHCAVVEKFVVENDVESTVSFVKKEVYNNKQNAAELVEKAKMCGMSTNSIGVPFLWDGEKCLTGDRDIIEFFKTKISG